MLDLFATPYLSRRHAPLDCIAVKLHTPLGGLSIFIEEIEPEMPQAPSAHGWKCLNTGLCGSVE